MTQDTVARLRTIQSRLKRESLLEREVDLAVNSQDSAKRIITAYRQLLSARKLLLFYHLLSIHPETLESQAKLLNPIIRLLKAKSGPGYFIDRAAYGSHLLKGYCAPMKFFSNNLETFAQCCCSFLKGNPDSTDRFTFSVVPGFFGSFWCRGIGDVFKKFFSALISTDFEVAIRLGRVIFTIPEFGFFIEKVVNEMKHKGRLVGQGTTAAAYVEDFVEKWRLNRDFCPSLVVSTLRVVGARGSSDVVRFLNESFLYPAISHGRIYHLHEVCFPWSDGVVASLIEAFSGKVADLANFLIQAECPASLPSFQEVLLVQPNIDNLFILSQTDLQDISALIAHARTIGIRGVGELVTCPPDLCKNVRYHLFDVQLQADEFIYQVSSKSAHCDELEVRLRKVLSKLPLIPVAPLPQDANSMVAFLKTQLPLTRDKYRLQIEVDIDELQVEITNSRQKYDLAGFVKLLETNFADREQQRYENLEKITFSRTSAEQLEFPVQHYLGELLWPATWPIQAEVFEEFMKTEPRFEAALLNESFDFVNRFMKCVELWIHWRDSHLFNYDMEFLLFHDYVMKYFPLNRYVSGSTAFGLNWSGLIEADKFVAAERARAPSPADEYRQEGAASRKNLWKKVFVDTPLLIEPLRQRMSDFLSAPTPGIALQRYNEISQLCPMAMKAAGLAEPGADDILPTMVMLRDLAKPDYFLTSIAFFDKTFRLILDQMKNHSPEYQLGTTYLFDSGKAFEYNSCELKILAGTLVEVYLNANPGVPTPYDFQD
jgi:hypothetical protein